MKKLFYKFIVFIGVFVFFNIYSCNGDKGIQTVGDDIQDVVEESRNLFDTQKEINDVSLFSDSVETNNEVKTGETEEQTEEVAITCEKIGDYGVGVTTLKTVTKSGRKLDIELWYPTYYNPQATPYSYLGILHSKSAVRDSAALTDDAPYPLILFSHGNQSVRFQSFFYTEYLAAHGYVVAAPSHPKNTLFDNVDTDENLAFIALERPADISAAIDRVLTPQPDDPAWLKGLVDKNKIGMSGHSFGAYTTLAIAPGAFLTATSEMKKKCEQNPNPPIFCSILKNMPEDKIELSDARIKAGLAMAPGGYMAFQDKGLASISIPMFIMDCKDDAITPYKEESLPIYKALKGQKLLLAIDKGGHYAFSNICDIVKLLPKANLPPEMTILCTDDAPYDVNLGFSLINYYGLAFFDYFIKGDDSALDRLKKKNVQQVPTNTYEYFLN